MAPKQLKIFLGFHGTAQGASMGDCLLINRQYARARERGELYFQYAGPGSAERTAGWPVHRAYELITGEGMIQNATDATRAVIAQIDSRLVAPPQGAESPQAPPAVSSQGAGVSPRAEEGWVIDLRITGFSRGSVTAIRFLNQLNHAIREKKKQDRNWAHVNCRIRFVLIDPVPGPGNFEDLMNVNLNDLDELPIEQGVIALSTDEHRSSFKPLSKDVLQVHGNLPILFLTYPGLHSDAACNDSCPTPGENSLPLVIAEQLSAFLLFEKNVENPVELMESYGSLVCKVKGYHRYHDMMTQWLFGVEERTVNKYIKNYTALPKYFIDEVHRTFFSICFPICYQAIQEHFKILNGFSEQDLQNYCVQLDSLKKLCVLFDRESVEDISKRSFQSPLEQELKWMRLFFPNTFLAFYRHLEKDIEIAKAMAVKEAPHSGLSMSFDSVDELDVDELDTREEHIKFLLQKTGLCQNLTQEFRESLQSALRASQNLSDPRTFHEYLHRLIQFKDFPLEELQEVRMYLCQVGEIQYFPQPDKNSEWVERFFEPNIEAMHKVQVEFLQIEERFQRCFNENREKLEAIKKKVGSVQSLETHISLIQSQIAILEGMLHQINEWNRASEDPHKPELMRQHIKRITGILDGLLEASREDFLKELKCIKLKISKITSFSDSNIERYHSVIQGMLDTIKRFNGIEGDKGISQEIVSEFERMVAPISELQLVQKMFFDCVRSFSLEKMPDMVVLCGQITAYQKTITERSSLIGHPPCLDGIRTYIHSLEVRIQNELSARLETRMQPMRVRHLEFQSFIVQARLIENEFNQIISQINTLEKSAIRDLLLSGFSQSKEVFDLVLKNRLTKQQSWIQSQLAGLENELSGYPISKDGIGKIITLLNVIETSYQAVISPALSNQQHPFLMDFQQNFLEQENKMGEILMRPFENATESLGHENLQDDSQLPAFLSRWDGFRRNLIDLDEPINSIASSSVRETLRTCIRKTQEKLKTCLEQRRDAIFRSIEALDIAQISLNGLIEILKRKRQALQSLIEREIDPSPMYSALSQFIDSLDVCLRIDNGILTGGQSLPADHEIPNMMALCGQVTVCRKTIPEKISFNCILHMDNLRKYMDLLETKIRDELKQLLDTKIREITSANLNFREYLSQVQLCENDFNQISVQINDLENGPLKHLLSSCISQAQKNLENILNQKLEEELSSLQLRERSIQAEFEQGSLSISEANITKCIELLNAYDADRKAVGHSHLSNDQYPFLDKFQNKLLWQEGLTIDLLKRNFDRAIASLAQENLNEDSQFPDFLNRWISVRQNLGLLNGQMRSITSGTSRQGLLFFISEKNQQMLDCLKRKRDEIFRSIEALDIEHAPLDGLIEILKRKKQRLLELNEQGMDTDFAYFERIDHVVHSLEAIKNIRKVASTFHQINYTNPNDFILHNLEKFRQIIFVSHQGFLDFASNLSDHPWNRMLQARYRQECETLKPLGIFYLQFMDSLIHYLVQSDADDRGKILGQIRAYYLNDPQGVRKQSWMDVCGVSPQQKETYTGSKRVLLSILNEWGTPYKITSFIARLLQTNIVLMVLSVVLPVISWPWILHAVISNHFRELAQKPFSDLHQKAPRFLQRSSDGRVVDALGGGGPGAAQLSLASQSVGDVSVRLGGAPSPLTVSQLDLNGAAAAPPPSSVVATTPA